MTTTSAVILWATRLAVFAIGLAVWYALLCETRALLLGRECNRLGLARWDDDGQGGEP